MEVKIKHFEREREESKAERAARERRERPYPLPGESFGAWLSRIGGPFVKVEVLQICPKCKRPVPSEEAAFHRCSERGPLSDIVIDKDCNLHIVERVFRDPKKIEEIIEKGDRNISFDKETQTFHFKREAFEIIEGKKQEYPIKTYLDFIRNKIEDGKSVVVDEEASKGFKEWVEKLKEEREKK
jgi:hypothetical protein